ncbi:MAG: radical SAM family heme chaperone HemW [Firmicutes bacterium]|nr:radical SAM family heme chaperone HemW [Bacillota bacterium]
MTDVHSASATFSSMAKSPECERAQPRSLYVHIPFCASKCFYCDFTSYVTGDSERDRYVQALLTEIRMVREAYFPGSGTPCLDTIFVGGGTPTMLSAKHWSQISEALHESFGIGADCEWTTEANPGSADRDLLGHLRSLGVNRVSFGAQTFNEMLLQAIGRLHSATDVLRSVKAAQQAGFERVNVDLMLGLPGQTRADVKEALAYVEKSGVTHVSAYGLKVEEGTPFGKWQKSGHLTLPDEEDEAEMYEFLRDTLSERGFVQYEISNFAQMGQEARHNLTYWRNQPYLAVGAGAHGYVHGQRYENVKGLRAYEEAVQAGRRPFAKVSVVTPEESMEDSLMLALRLREGLSRERFALWHGQALDAVFGPVIQSLTARGWLADDGERIWIPPAYYEVANEVFAAFIGIL